MRDRKRVGSRQRSLSFLSFLPRRERPLLVGNYQNYVIDKLTCEIMENKNALSSVESRLLGGEF